MTGDHDALLRAICENPREDTPRLVFADWLEENGQPERAAFLRTDVEMARRDEWDSERLRWEESITLRAIASLHWGASLLPALDPLAFHWVGTPVTRRGFPWGLHVNDLGQFRDVAAGLLARHPIGCLSFRHGLPQLNWFVSEPWFPRVFGLEWPAGRYSPQKLQPLLQAPNAGLTELTLRSVAVSPAGLRAVCESPVAPNLTRLNLVGNGPQVARVLLDSLRDRPSAFPRLRSLTVRGEGLHRDMQSFACHLPEGLRILDVAHSRINSAAVQEFAAVRATSGLRVLTLTGNGIGNDGATAVFTSPHLAGLKVLDLSFCQVGDDALRALLDGSPLADGLNLLNLTGSPASADMKQAVKDRMGERVRL